MSVKLYYFDGCGRAEAIRWILSYAGVAFEDIRFPAPLPNPKIPPAIKARCRWGQVPLIEFEGKSLVQSIAIARYFAKKYNLVPTDRYQAALCDEYVDAIQDLGNAFWPVIFQSDSEDDGSKKEAELNELIQSTKTRYLDKFDMIINANGGKYLVGDQLTWGDIYLAQIIEQFEILLGKNLAQECEHVNKLKEAVMNAPNIKAWLDRRPKSDF